MVSQNFNPLAAFQARAFSPEFTGNRDGIGADRARLMCWADDAPFFLAGAQRNNAVSNSKVVDAFLKNSGSIVALTPTDEFRAEAGISQSGAIGALDTANDQIYLDVSWQNNEAVIAAAQAFARAYRPDRLVAA